MEYPILLFVIGILFIAYLILNLLNKNHISSNSIKKKYCPLCGTLLKPDEPILAEMDKTSIPIKVYIKGCRNCYKNFDYSDKDKNLENIDYGNITNK